MLLLLVLLASPPQKTVSTTEVRASLRAPLDAPERPPRFLLLPTVPDEAVSADDARAIEDSLAAALAAQPCAEVIAARDAGIALPADPWACLGEVACVRGLAAASRADFVLGSLAVHGRDRQVHSVVAHHATGAIVGQATTTLAGAAGDWVGRFHGAAAAFAATPVVRFETPFEDDEHERELLEHLAAAGGEADRLEARRALATLVPRPGDDAPLAARCAWVDAHRFRRGEKKIGRTELARLVDRAMPQTTWVSSPIGAAPGYFAAANGAPPPADDPAVREHARRVAPGAEALSIRALQETLARAGLRFCNTALAGRLGRGVLRVSLLVLPSGEVVGPRADGDAPFDTPGFVTCALEQIAQLRFAASPGGAVLYGVPLFLTARAAGISVSMRHSTRP